VASPSDCDLKTGVTGELDRRDHIVVVGALRNQRRIAVNRTIPDPAALLVGRILRSNQPPVEGPLELVQGSFVDLDSDSDGDRPLLMRWRRQYRRF
jgi:hypothetical protein